MFGNLFTPYLSDLVSDELGELNALVNSNYKESLRSRFPYGRTDRQTDKQIDTQTDGHDSTADADLE